MSGNYFPTIGEVLDEVPIDTDFLLENKNIFSGEKGPQLDLDPLSDPLELPIPVVEEDRGLDVGVADAIVIPKRSQQYKVPTSYQNMSVTEFCQEMENNIHDIVYEAIWLGKDPWEYHPFYLRVYKYITTGQRLGYVSVDTVIVNNIWKSFFEFAEDLYKRFRDESGAQAAIEFTGEKSPYASFLLTKKVHINGKLMTPKRDRREIDKLFKSLEQKAKLLKTQWKVKKGNTFGGVEDGFRNDLGMKLTFFNECKLITFPGDVLRMNNLWTKFLGKETLTKKRNTGAKARSTALPHSSAHAKVRDGPQISEKVMQQNSMYVLKRLIIQVIVVPPKAGSQITSTCPPSSSPPTCCSQISQSGETDDLSIMKNTPQECYSSPPSPSSPPTCRSQVSQSGDTDDVLIIRKASKKSNSSPPLATVVQKQMPTLQQGATRLKRKLVRKHAAATSVITFHRKREKIQMLKRKLAGISKKTDVQNNALVSRQLMLEKMVVRRKLVRPTKKPNKQSSTDQTKNQRKITAPIIVSRKKYKRLNPKSQEKIIKRRQIPKKAKGNLLQKLSAKRRLDLKKKNIKPIQERQLKLEKIISRRRRSGKTPKTTQCNPPTSSGRGTRGKRNKSPSCAPRCVTPPELPNKPSSIEPDLETDLRVQESSEQSPQSKSSCDICGKSVDSDYLLIHELTHNLPPVCCPVCSIEYKERKALWSHYCQNHLQQENPTIAESILPTNGTNLFATPITREPTGKGKQTSDQCGNSTCDQCGKIFQNLASLQRHRYLVHGEGQLRQNYLQCAYCPKQFKGKDQLTSHIGRVHEETIKSKCDDCGKDLQSSGKLWKHLMDSHEVSASDAAELCNVTYIMCNYCGDPFLVGRQMSNHVKSVHPEKVEEFRQIQKEELKASAGHPADTIKHAKGISLQRLRQKLRKRELTKTFKETGEGPQWIAKRCVDQGNCPDCGGKFIPKGYAKHRKSIHGVIERMDKYIDCPVKGCNDIFKRARCLRIHVSNSHTKHVDRRIVELKLVKLMERHKSGFTVYRCTLCGDHLFHPAEVKVHMLFKHEELFQNLVKEPLPSHQQLKHFKCPYCDIENTCDEELRKHVELTHPQNCWHCPEEDCGKVLLNPEDLAKHFLEEHDEEKRITSKEDVKFLKMENAQGMAWNEWRNKKRDWFEKICVNCEICEGRITLGEYARHLRVVHNVKEDGDNLACKTCVLGRLESKYKTRAGWLYHMTSQHGEEVDMNEMLERAKKINTTVDWQTLQIQNPSCRKSLENHSKFSSRGKNKVKETNKSPSSEEQEDVEPDYTNFVWRNMKKLEYAMIRVKCEICGMKISLASYGGHVKRAHCVEEDGSNLSCKCVEDQLLDKFERRDEWLYHLGTEHDNEVDMMEMLERASKINTKVDWRTLETKNPHDVIFGRKITKAYPQDVSKYDWLKMEKIDYERIPVNCEICGLKLILISYRKHVRDSHNLLEDGDNLSCECDLSPFRGRFLTRESWLFHMGTKHVGDVDMEEMLERAKKINTKEDWRTLKVKNPEGSFRRGFFKRRLKNMKRFKDVSKQTANKRKKESSGEENETEESSSSAKEALTEKPATKSNEGSNVRRSSRQPKKNVRYSEKVDDSDSDQSNEKIEKRVSKKRELPGRTGRWYKSPNDRASNLVNTFEREKRLIIKLTRLREVEIIKYCRK